MNHFETNLIGKYVGFSSAFRPMRGGNYDSVWGEVVCVYNHEPRKHSGLTESYNCQYQITLIVRLETFDKDSLYEIPLPAVKVFYDKVYAEEYCRPM